MQVYSPHQCEGLHDCRHEGPSHLDLGPAELSGAVAKTRVQPQVPNPLHHWNAPQ